MYAKTYIETTLKELDQLYNQATSQKKTIYFSKLALIELCGWIEESVDDILLRHSTRRLKVVSNREYYREKVVEPNYGFQYKKNIRPMLIGAIGIVGVEKFEKKLEKKSQVTLLKTYLGNLREDRNQAAHTHLKGITRRYNAPSHVIGDYRRISTVLDNFDVELRKIN